MRRRRSLPDPEQYPEELWGIEDPRITFVEELGNTSWPTPRSAEADPASRSRSPRTSISFERLGLVMQPDDKDAALLPRRIDGSFALVHRPIADSGAHVWISFSPDLRSWGGHQLCCRRGAGLVGRQRSASRHR